MTHDLNIRPEYLEAVKSGKKKFEIRRNDRNYGVGDTLILREWDGENYTGSGTVVKVTYVLGDYAPGLKPGYCILGIE